MAYADAVFYADGFLMGRTPIIPDAEFPYWAKRASDAVDAPTFGRVKVMPADKIPVEVKECCCALAELLYKQDKQSSIPGSDGGAVIVPSGVSINFLPQTTPTEAASAVRGVITEYLARTGLLYRGVD